MADGGAVRRDVVEPETEGLDALRQDALAVDGVAVPVGPGVVGIALAFGLDELDVTPAAEVEHDVVIRDAAREVFRAGLLQVQYGAATVAMDPEPEGLVAAEVERGREGPPKLAPGAHGRRRRVGRRQAHAERAALHRLGHHLERRRDAGLGGALREGVGGGEVDQGRVALGRVGAGGHQALDAHAQRLGGEAIADGPDAAVALLQANDLLSADLDRAELPGASGILEEGELGTGLAQGLLDRVGEVARLPQGLVVPHDAGEPWQGGDLGDGRGTDTHDREAAVIGHGLAAEVLDVVGVRGLAVEALPGLEGPPTQVSRQELAQQGGIALAVQVDEALVAAVGVVPGAHAGTYIPEVVVEGAHLHDGRPLQAFPDLEDELGFIVPGDLAAGDGIAAIERVEVDHVKAGGVEELGGLGGRLGEERRVAVRHEEAKALTQVICLGALGVGGRPSAVGTPLAGREAVRRRAGDGAVGDQLVVDAERGAVAHEEAGDRRQRGGGLGHEHRRRLRRQVLCQSEGDVAAEAGVGHGGDPGAVLGHEHGVGVQSCLNAGGVQLVDHSLHALDAAREEVRGRLAVAEAE